MTREKHDILVKTYATVRLKSNGVDRLCTYKNSTEMDAGSAYILKQVLTHRWGDDPCPHPRIEPVGLPSPTGPYEWFCLNCGRSVDMGDAAPEPYIEVHEREVQEKTKPVPEQDPAKKPVSQ